MSGFFIYFFLIQPVFVVIVCKRKYLRKGQWRSRTAKYEEIQVSELFFNSSPSVSLLQST